MPPTQAIPFFPLIIFVSTSYVLALEKKKTIVKVPKGTYSYQAAWIVDAETSEHEDDDESEDDEYEEDMVCTKDEMNIVQAFQAVLSYLVSSDQGGGVFQLGNGQNRSHFHKKVRATRGLVSTSLDGVVQNLSEGFGSKKA